MSLTKGDLAIAAARIQSERGPKFEAGMCLREVRQAYGLGGLYPDAATAWREGLSKHTDTNPPRGVPVFWTGGRSGHGHVAISDGDGYVWSTDSKRLGYFDRVPLRAPVVDWGLSYAGWSEHLNAVRVYLDPWADAPKPLPRNFRKADRALTRAMTKASTASRRALAKSLRKALRQGLK